MEVQKVKPHQASPTFEKMNRERLQQSRDAKHSAKQAVDKAHELVLQSKELVQRLRDKKRKAS